MANKFLESQQINVGTGEVTLFTVPTDKVAILIDCACANVTNVEVLGTVTRVNLGSAVNLIKAGPIPVGGSMVVSGAPRKVVMNAGTSLKAVCNTVAGMDVSVSYLLQDQLP